MKKTKKILAVIMATASLATSALTIPASASTKGATVSRNFSVSSYTVNASVSLGYSNYYGAATSCNYSAVTYRSVSLSGTCSNGDSVYDSGYSYSDTAGADVYAVEKTYFTNGISDHYASTSSTSGSTTMTF